MGHEVTVTTYRKCEVDTFVKLQAMSLNFGLAWNAALQSIPDGLFRLSVLVSAWKAIEMVPDKADDPEISN